MITKISIKNTASYGEIPAILNTDKKVNLIYGLNGTGKTTAENCQMLCKEDNRRKSGK